MKKFPLLLLAATCVMVTAESCKRDKMLSGNPLLAEWDTPFGVPPFDEIKTSHYLPAFEAAMREHNREIKEITDNKEAPAFGNTVLAMDNSGELLERVSSVFFLLSAADTDPELQDVYEKVAPMISAHYDEIMLNDKLFEKIRTVYEARNTSGLDPLQKRLVEKTYKNFERSGAMLAGEDKKEFKQINQDLSLATFQFGKNLLEENARYQLVLTDDDLAGLPHTIRTAGRNTAKKAGLDGNKYIYDISKPGMLPFLTYSDRRDLREELYTAYIEKCNHDDELDNKGLVNSIIELRTRRAHLLGYKSHADYVLDNVMAKTPENVYALLDELWEPALNRAKEELIEMQEIQMRSRSDEEFASWDWWYYAEKVRKSKYNLDQESLRPYFSLENVRQGIFELCNRLYGITFSPVVVPVYHEECSAFEVLDIDMSHLGILIMDLHPRPGRKGPGAWCGSYRDQSYKDGERVAPIVTIVCNFTRPTSETTPALLDLDEVETFFHEFGHAIQSLFSDVPYNGLSGVERDFVELPSQIMENWAVEPEMLRSYAIHHSNDKVIPDDLIAKIQQAAVFNQGFMTTELLAASYIDMDIHTLQQYAPIDVNEFERAMLNEKRELIPQIEPRYRYTYFAHIFDGGYSAGYYSYIWAEVLDKDAYQAFVETGEIFNKNVAARFRQEVLSKGGTADGMTLYRNFRGKEPSRQPLLVARGLVAE